MTLRLLTLLAAVLLASGPALADGGQADPAAVKLYTKHCQSCHGPDGSGNPDKAKALKIDPKLLHFGRAEAQGLTRDQMKSVLMTGKDKMPAYERKLKPAEMELLADYVVRLREELAKKK